MFMHATIIIYRGMCVVCVESKNSVTTICLMWFVKNRIYTVFKSFLITFESRLVMPNERPWSFDKFSTYENNRRGNYFYIVVRCSANTIANILIFSLPPYYATTKLATTLQNPRYKTGRTIKNKLINVEL